MKNSSKTLSKQIVITNELGLHARSAAMIAKAAQKACSSVWIEKDGERVDASSIIDILSLACPKGNRITVAINDPADINVLDNIVRMVKEGFGE